MIPLTFLYDRPKYIDLEYIDWPKLSEQKNPFGYIVPLPQVGWEQLVTKKLLNKNSLDSVSFPTIDDGLAECVMKNNNEDKYTICIFLDMPRSF